jgi:hypothetical protein
MSLIMAQWQGLRREYLGQDETAQAHPAPEAPPVWLSGMSGAGASPWVAIGSPACSTKGSLARKG